VLDRREFGFLCSNAGRNATSINGAGYWTTDGEERDLGVKEDLPVQGPGRGEVLLHIDRRKLATAAMKLRSEGRGIEGFWVRRIGMKLVRVSTHPDVLKTINESEPGPLIG